MCQEDAGARLLNRELSRTFVVAHGAIHLVRGLLKVDATCLSSPGYPSRERTFVRSG
jgi:hypothetical protein